MDVRQQLLDSIDAQIFALVADNRHIDFSDVVVDPDEHRVVIVRCAEDTGFLDVGDTVVRFDHPNDGEDTSPNWPHDPVACGKVCGRGSSEAYVRWSDGTVTMHEEFDFVSEIDAFEVLNYEHDLRDLPQP